MHLLKLYIFASQVCFFTKCNLVIKLLGFKAFYFFISSRNKLNITKSFIEYLCINKYFVNLCVTYLHKTWVLVFYIVYLRTHEFLMDLMFNLEAYSYNNNNQAGNKSKLSSKTLKDSFVKTCKFYLNIIHSIFFFQNPEGFS